jgi:mRNA-degrading endonuclease RelE of RelBE toxin-antitoxin system
MLYKVYWTETFKKEFSKLPKPEQDRVQNFIHKQLTTNPTVGKPLSVYNIREKKLNGRRVYYIFYEDKVIVLMVAISGKKDQQETIDLIKTQLPAFMQLVEELSSK